MKIKENVEVVGIDNQLSKNVVIANGGAISNQMITNHKITDTSSEEVFVIESAIEWLNSHLFNSCLGKMKVTILPDATLGGKRSTYGWFSPYAWTNGDKNKLIHELNITANSIARPFKEIFITIIHELIHVYAMANGIKDTSRQGRYHNKEFKSLCEKFGLEVIFDDKNGYMTPHDKMTSSVEVLYNRFLETLSVNVEDLFNYARCVKTKQKKEPKPKKIIVFTCPICGNTIKFNKEVNIQKIVCACGEDMQVDIEED